MNGVVSRPRTGGATRRLATTKVVPLLATLMMALALVSVAHAQEREYVVELILFEHLGGDATGAGFWYPAPRRAVTLGGEEAAALGIVPSARALTLDVEARMMESSGRYRVLQHLHWRQPGFAAGDAVRLRIDLGSAIELFVPEDSAGFGDFLPAARAPRPNRSQAVRTTTLSGYLQLRLGRFLHLDADLVYTDLDGGRSFRLEESRKMRSRELHYVDNPRIGMLVRIVPAEETVDDVGGDAAEALEADDEAAASVDAGDEAMDAEPIAPN